MTTTSTTNTPLAGCGALVTGGSRGIGRAVATRLATDGATVVFTYATRHDAAAETVAAITDAGGRARAVRLDLTEVDRFGDVFVDVDAALDPAGLDIVVANAGIFATGSIEATDAAGWDRVMAVNARGAFLTLKHAARRIRDGGRIVTMSTIGTAWPSPGEAAYAASKAAVEQISRVASRELGGRGVTVNTVSPGPTDTDLLRAGASEDALAGVAAMTALGRVGLPADVADLVAHLVHPDCRWVTGQNIRVDGGLA